MDGGLTQIYALMRKGERGTSGRKGKEVSFRPGRVVAYGLCSEGWTVGGSGVQTTRKKKRRLDGIYEGANRLRNAQESQWTLARRNLAKVEVGVKELLCTHHESLKPVETRV